MDINRYGAMLSYIPHFYRTSSIFNAILGSEGSELDLLRQSIDDLKAQFFIETATWGLDLWEREYGLTPNDKLTYKFIYTKGCKNMNQHDCEMHDRVRELERFRDKTEIKLEEHATNISRLWGESRAIDQRVESLKETLEKLAANVEKIANTIDKAKGYLITGILSPVVLAAIFAALALIKK